MSIRKWAGVAFVLLAVALPSGAKAFAIIDGLINVHHTFASYLGGAWRHGDWTGAGHGNSTPSVLGFKAGNQLNDSEVDGVAPAYDGSYVEERGFTFGHWNSNGAIWDLGLSSKTVDIFPFIDTDHSWWVQELREGTDFRVYGSNTGNPNGTWHAAAWTATWSEGYRSDAEFDDYASRWMFTTPYRYIGIVAGNPEVLSFNTKTQINAVGTPDPIPEPGSLLLLGSGLLGLAGAWRTNRRRSRPD